MAEAKDRKWRVTLEVEESIVREFHEQERTDPGTTDGDVRDALVAFLNTAGDEFDLEIDVFDESGILITEIVPAPEE
jgi:hypothetical protein